MLRRRWTALRIARESVIAVTPGSSANGETLITIFVSPMECSNPRCSRLISMRPGDLRSGGEFSQPIGIKNEK
jgi:hypothetical protein